MTNSQSRLATNNVSPTWAFVLTESQSELRKSLVGAGWGVDVGETHIRLNGSNGVDVEVVRFRFTKTGKPTRYGWGCLLGAEDYEAMTAEERDTLDATLEGELTELMKTL